LGKRIASRLGRSRKWVLLLARHLLLELLRDVLVLVLELLLLE
jgi:hypothetical protein